jgi:iron(III) transport system ATP-binding protein
VDLHVAPGELVTLLGPSGCGKSTVLRLVAGLEPVDGGMVRLDGHDLTGLPPHERPVGLVFQNYALFPHRTVAGNVAYGLEGLGLDRDAIAVRTGEALAAVGLQGLADRSPDQLSGGQQQRVALARALAPRPRVLLFDEPLSNLDARLRRRMREEIRALQQDLRITALYVTHDQAEALAVGDRVAVMADGRLCQVGPPRAVHDTPVDEFVAGFVGEGRLWDTVADATGCLRLAGTALAVPGLPRRNPGQRGTVLVRPWGWWIRPASTAGLAGRVRRGHYLGDRMEYTIEIALGEILVIDRATGCRHEDGAPVSLALDPDGVAWVGPPPAG